MLIKSCSVNTVSEFPIEREIEIAVEWPDFVDEVPSDDQASAPNKMTTFDIFSHRKSGDFVVPSSVRFLSFRNVYVYVAPQILNIMLRHRFRDVFKPRSFDRHIRIDERDKRSVCVLYAFIQRG